MASDNVAEELCTRSDHDVHIICNGGPHLNPEDSAIKSGLPTFLLCSGCFSHQHMFNACLDVSSTDVLHTNCDLFLHGVLFVVEQFLIPSVF